MSTRVFALAGPSRRSLRRWLAVTASAGFGFGPIASSMAGGLGVLPQGGSVAAGQATIGAPANNSLTVNQGSQNAVINWNSFSIGQSNIVTYHQPNAGSAALNRVTGGTPSTLAGRLNANGQLYLVNPNGVAITKTGIVQVGGGFVGSTLGISDDDFMSGKRTFKGNGHSATVSNAGRISAGKGGFVGLIGGTASNSGTVRVQLGKVGLGSGESVTLDVNGDGFMQVAVPTASKAAAGGGLVDVSGRINAPGGSIELEAATVKQAIRNAVNVSGALSARSLSGHSGSIVLGGGAGGKVNVSGSLDVSAGRSAARAASVRSASAIRNARAAAAARSALAPADGGSIAITGADVAIGDKASLKALSWGARGGAISVTGDTLSIGSATLDVSGATGGGRLLIGGGPQGAGPLADAGTVRIASGATLTANATRDGDGGQIVVWSDNSTTIHGALAAQGAGSGGGGKIETSGHILDVAGAAVTASAPHGAAGVWLLDPYDLNVSGAATTANQNPAGTWTSTGAGGAVLNTDIDAALNGGTNVVLQTSATPGAGLGNLNVYSPIAWTTNTTLTLTASNDVNVYANITATGDTAGIVINPNTAVGSAPASGSGTFNVQLASITLSGATPSLSIGGFAYTIINSLGIAQDAVVPPAQPSLQGVASSDLTAHYALGSDIAAGATAGWNAGAGFTPIGTVGLPFNGTFDGLGHTITGLTINRPATADVGLFGSTGTGSVIRNVGLVGGSVLATSSTGGLVGSNTGGAIVNSYNTGSVTGTSSLGGLAGSNTGSIRDSYTTGNVSGTSSVGGLVGGSTGPVTDSYAAGNVTGTSSVGGLIGGSTGAVTDSYATGNVSGSSSVGGLIGGSTGTITHVYSTGAVTGSSSVGGLLGSSTGDVYSSYWNTETSGQATSAGAPEAIGLTSAQMMQQSNFVEWDFVNTWIIYNGLTDPLLRHFMAPLTVTANNANKTYNGQAFSGGNGVTYSVTPAVGTVLGAVTYGGSSQGAVNAGGYAITPSGLYSNQQGYQITYGDGALTVAPALATVTGAKVYDATTGFVVGQLAVAGGVNGETLSLTAGTGTAETPNVGTASGALSGLELAVSGGNALASNYLLPETGLLTITQAALTYVANPASRTYGAANPALSGTTTGYQGDDTQANSTTGTLSFTTPATPSSNVGRYLIAGGGLTPNSGNYRFVQAAGNSTALTITQAPASVTGAKVYDGTTGFVVGQLAVAGGVNGETLSLTAGTGTAPSPDVGTTIGTLSGLALSVAGGNGLASNYLLPTSGLLTIIANGAPPYIIPPIPPAPFVDIGQSLFFPSSFSAIVIPGAVNDLWANLFSDSRSLACSPESVWRRFHRFGTVELTGRDLGSCERWRYEPWDARRGAAADGAFPIE
ncbi:filamentous hemagglutinin family protein [Roseiarcus fermentans]|uniref:Filamentous hemagglutinin family protein n=2 Tax=Roseiarcus fermentans TaxID=1473586 RepID=A0A366FUJ7_9HYPH|nr:filamentous hemagglutinin family protein [Roseiarcus fermentans]